MDENIEYELLTKKIYQLLLNKQGYNTVEVQHNITLKGKSNVEHQIDVYWQLEVAGVIHKVAVECKNYSSSITLEKVRNFHAVLQDIGNTYGIMVTKTGFQKGVIDYAKHHGIDLKLLRNPIEEDWDGRVKKIQVNLNIVLPKIKDRRFNFDEEWINANIEKDKLKDGCSISGMADEIWIFEKNGERYKNLHEIEQSVPQNWKTEFDLEHTVEFDDKYIETVPLGKIKIKGISFKYDVLTSEGEKVIIDAQEIVDKVLKDVLTNDIKFIRRSGTID
jgi:hypothetical protein